MRVVADIGFVNDLYGSAQRFVSLLHDGCVFLHWNQGIRIAHHVDEWDFGIGKRFQHINGIAGVSQRGRFVLELVTLRARAKTNS